MCFASERRVAKSPAWGAGGGDSFSQQSQGQLNLRSLEKNQALDPGP